jgi:hypothetical protein
MQATVSKNEYCSYNKIIFFIIQFIKCRKSFFLNQAIDVQMACVVVVVVVA